MDQEELRDSLGNIPPWLKNRIERRCEPSRYVEIEVKYIVPKKEILSFIRGENITKQEVEQAYLSESVIDSFKNDLLIPKDIVFKEWRIRRIDDKFLFTAKSVANEEGMERGEGMRRQEFEVGISSGLYYSLLSRAKEPRGFSRISKTRHSSAVDFADDKVLIQVDDYHAIGQVLLDLDFVICEVEVHRSELARILTLGRYFAPRMVFLKQGINVTGIEEFSNRHLSEYGFPANRYPDVLRWLNVRSSEGIERGKELIQQGRMADGIKVAREALDSIEIRSAKAPIKLESDDFSLTQDVLKELAFTIKDSLGRKDAGDKRLAKLDRADKGWLRDYHEIISCDCYIRLHSKPQMFRPGLGYTNTTTRGAHTSDVIACSMEIARQLGLNVELCIAAAALHDIGQPAGGHIGEQVLKEKSKREFEHQFFSLSLSEIFGLNLLREVMDCAHYHKSKGEDLVAPSARQQEYGVVRLADKISYCPWDIFDSINNRYFTKQDITAMSKTSIGLDVFEVLGKTAMDWIWTLIYAAVRESAEAHCVRFSEKSGDIYRAFKEARRIVFEELHSRIQWMSLRAQLGMAYDKIENSFQDIEDIVPIVAYLTDQELIELTKIIENEPMDRELNLTYLKAHGFGFCEIIEKIRKFRKKGDTSLIYYRYVEKT